MRILRLARLYAFAVLVLVMAGGIVLRPGSRVQAERSPAPPAERVLTAGL